MNWTPAPDSPAKTAAALGVAVFLALALVGGLFEWLRDDLLAAREAAARKIVLEALSVVPHNNDPLSDRKIPRFDRALEFAEAGELFFARRDGEVAAVAVRARAAGYGGAIEFVAVFRPGESVPLNLIVFRHRETPGIADFLDSPSGGVRALDGVAGATVTSRAVQKAAGEIGERLRENPDF